MAESSGDLCQVCGEYMVFEGGCEVCKYCGYYITKILDNTGI